MEAVIALLIALLIVAPLVVVAYLKAEADAKKFRWRK